MVVATMAMSVSTLRYPEDDLCIVVFSNRGFVLLRGRRVPVAGLVNMDMTMLDVTDVECAVGDAATLLGRDGDALLDVNQVSRDAELSPYELLVGLRLRVPRVYVA